MAYLRWGSRLPSGKTSRFYVFPTSQGLESQVFDETNPTISYPDLLKLMKLSKSEFKKHLGKVLKIDGEELRVLSSLLIEDVDCLRHSANESA